MHPRLKDGRVGIYARFSSDRQQERSIEDQVRRCRDYIAQAGGDPTTAEVFSDFAISGSSLARPGFEAMMHAIDARRIEAIVTEDLSRISRDFADSAQIFKRLQFAEVPLLGVADGIDTSSRHAKLSFTVKSLVADLYLDDLRDKTLRGLEGRALAGYATGNTPYGFRTVAEIDSYGRTIGHRIEIDEDQAQLIRRIFAESAAGTSLSVIAKRLNAEGIPSPRARTRHTRFGWGSSTIRAILYNEKYAGTWRFKERQWVKVPGTNKRRPRNRDAADVMSFERPELRIIDPDLWQRTQERLAAVKRKYTGDDKTVRVASGSRNNYLLSGLLVCDACSAPLTIYGGAKGARYYRCSENRNKGTCSSTFTVREDVARRRVLEVIRDRVASPKGIAYVRKQIALHLRDSANKLDAELKERRARLTRTEEKIAGLIQFISEGDRSEYVVKSLRDLEAHARAEKAAIERLVRETEQPLRLPSLAEIAQVTWTLEDRLAQDPEAGRARLRSWFKGEQLRVSVDADGSVVGRGILLPLVVLSGKNENLSGREAGEVFTSVRSGGRI